MIGHYLLTLTPDAEHDVLTGQMRPGAYRFDQSRCLVGWAADCATEYLGNHLSRFRRRHLLPSPSYEGNVESRYDRLCARFGVERTNAAIRNRILSNIARRELAGVRATVPA